MSWFPILVLYVESNEQVVCNEPKNIRDGIAFKVLETKVRGSKKGW